MAELSDWRPSAKLEVLKLRARILEGMRAYFSTRGVLEVETPVLSTGAATDRHLESFSTSYRGPGLPPGMMLYLHTSPEFAMKRLLAAGSGPIYQICRVFRQGEAGRRHNPEFTMLEWYRPGFDHHALMDEVEALVTPILGPRLKLAPEMVSYCEAFMRHAGINPHKASVSELREAASRRGIAGEFGEERDAWLDLLLTQVVEPQLGRGRLTFLYEYPASQAALAQLTEDDDGNLVAERFELYFAGVELANGYHELADSAEQRRRFEADNASRRASDKREVPHDEWFLAALEEQGLPDCAGVALGVDRLVMLAAGANSLAEVMAFPIERA
jgi:lysyl-tRNA synthetase class 2